MRPEAGRRFVVLCTKVLRERGIDIGDTRLQPTAPPPMAALLVLISSRPSPLAAYQLSRATSSRRRSKLKCAPTCKTRSLEGQDHAR
jgi:hypothetical protein